jgi:hypothetical protein
MKSKAPLALMEQLVMVLVVALAAALCLQAFTLADQISRRNAEQGRALTQAQNAVEMLKNVHGDFEEAARLYGGTWNGLMWGWSLDEDWGIADGTVPLAYHVLVTPTDSAVPLLGTADVSVYTADGEQLCSLPAAWQEVDGDA